MIMTFAITGASIFIVSVFLAAVMMSFASWVAVANPFSWLKDILKWHAIAKKAKALEKEYAAKRAEREAEYAAYEKKCACAEAARVERNKALAAREKAIEKLERKHIEEHGTEEELDAFDNGVLYSDIYLGNEAPNFRELVPMPA